MSHVAISKHTWRQALGFAFVILVLFILGSRAESAKDGADAANRSAVEANQRQIEVLERVNARQEQAVVALCSFVVDLRGRIRHSERRLARSKKFLKDNPRGVGAITPTLIRAGIADDMRSLDSQRRTLAALSTPLDCPVP